MESRGQNTPVLGNNPFSFILLRIIDSLLIRYCFGAPYVCNELAGDQMTAGAFAHPAFLKEHHFRNLKSKCQERLGRGGRKLIDITEPLLLSCAEVDHTFGADSRRQAIDMLIEDKKTFQVQLFSGVAHGFALRGDMENPYERKLY
jgi:dienelactone hydrolase